MKLSSKSLYAVRALFNMAYHGRTTPSKIDEIARLEDVPPRFLEQIFQDLKKAGIVGSKRGPKGGYFLMKNPRDITLGHVIRAMEGETHVSFCREQAALREGDTRPPSLTVMDGVWDEIATRIDGVLDGVTLQDLVQRGETKGLKREGYNEFVYII